MSKSSTLRLFGTSLRMWLIGFLVLGLAYPLVISLIGAVVFPNASTGSPVLNEDGRVVGSHLVGQQFLSDRYFHVRPSAVGYAGSISGGSNLGPTSKELAEALRERADRTADAYRLDAEHVPVDMITASGSGLDPDISVANALVQVPAVAEARGMSENDLRELVIAHVREPDLGFMGERRVNVLELNLALDEAVTP